MLLLPCWLINNQYLPEGFLEIYRDFVVVVQSLICVQLFVTPWTAEWQASLSFAISQSLLKLMTTESEMPSNHLVLCLSPPAFSLSQHQGLFK